MALQHPKLAANLSFLFQERDFLDRFSAAAACGKAHAISWTALSFLVDETLSKFVHLSLGLSIYRVSLQCTHSGFKGVEFGAEVPSQWTKEQLVAAKESAGVEVVSLCTPLGQSLRKDSHS